MKSVSSKVLGRIFTLIFLVAFSLSGFSKSGDEADTGFNPGEMIMHHITDAHEWHVFDGFTIPLPVILYSDKGLDIFMSSKFEHGHASYKGYIMDNGHIIAEDGSSFYDVSITKNVASLLFTAGLMMFLFLSVAKGYKKNEGKAPKGIQSLFEPIIIFVRDEIVRPNITNRPERFVPYLLTVFFFVWFGNLLGLLPGAANLTGNIAVTAVLAILTFIITNVNGNRHYWKHVFWTPGVPTLLKIIIVPVEIIGLFTKPFSLLIRLFVAISAGHIVILSLLSLGFIFHSYTVGVGGSLVVLFINLIELLVATIQAYVFTMFSALYIGMAVEKQH